MTILNALQAAKFSRRSMMMTAGVGAAGFTLSQASFLRSAAAQSESLQDILDVTCTVERFGVTFLGAGLESNAAGNFDQPWPDLVVAVVEAARAQEAAHLAAFEAAGGQALTDTFTVPPDYLTDFVAFFSAVVEQETGETAAQIAAMRAFSELGRPDIAKISFQYAAEEAEHRLLANYTRGTRPANDRAFAHAPYETATEFLDALRSRGIIDGVGTELVYPGPGEIDDSNVIETEPGGVSVDCGTSGTPEATPGSTPGATPEA